MVWKWHVVSLLLVIAAGVVAYSNSIHGSFHYDDIDTIARNPFIRDLNPSKVWSGNNHFRFIGFYSFALNYRLGGIDNVRKWHYVNISIHLLNAILLYCILSSLMRDVHIAESKIPLITSLLFVVHPICSEPVNYIQARHVLFYSFFCLTGMLCTILLIRTKSMIKKVISTLGILVSIIMGGLSKEVGIFYIPATIGTYMLIFKYEDKKVKSIFCLLIVSVIVIVPIVFIIMTEWGMSFADIFQMGGRTFIRHLLTEAQIFWKYLSLLIPLSSLLNVEHHVGIARIDTFGQLLIEAIPLLHISLVLIFAFRLKAMSPLTSFLFLWSIVGLLPYMLVPGSAHLMVEYKAYLSSMGLIGGLVALYFDNVAYLSFKKGSVWYAKMVFGIIFSLLIIFCIKETRVRNQVWRTEFTLWNDAVTKSPMKAKPYIARGVAYVEMGKFDNAIFDFNQALSLNPYCTEIVEVYNNRGIAYLGKGEHDEAISDFNRALSLGPNYTKAYNSRGVVYRTKGEYDKAIFDFNHALSLNPNYAMAYYNRAITYFRKREYDKAYADVKKAQNLGHQIHPEFLEELYNASNDINNWYSMYPPNSGFKVR